MTSPEWDLFMENYYGDPFTMWHDGIDETSVTRLKDEERDQAEDMLIASLEEGSHYGAIGLRELRSTKALPYLEERLKTSAGTLAVEIAVALCLIKQTLDYVPYIITALQKSVFWSDRIRAARALRRFPTKEVVEVLFQAVAEDSDYLVRNHASETILFLHGLQPSISSHKEIFGHMIVDYDKENETSTANAFEHYNESAKMLKRLVEKDGKLRKGPILLDIWSWKD